MPGHDDIRYEVVDGRAEITLDRPDVLNAYRGGTLDELDDALGAALGDGGVYAVLLTGAGRGFCAGRDLSTAPERAGRTDEAERLERVSGVLERLHRGGKPTVAAVNGPAVGGGAELALACDFRVMAADAFLRDGHVDVGVTPATAGGWLLPRLIGAAKAREYVLLGEDITAEDAADLGLAVEVVEGDVRRAGRRVANRLRDKPARALRASKRLLRSDGPFGEHAEAVVDARLECLGDEECREAAAAAREGREPAFDRERADR